MLVGLLVASSSGALFARRQSGPLTLRFERMQRCLIWIGEPVRRAGGSATGVYY